jgi:hypothetical protein
MKHFIFNLSSGAREQAAALLQAKMWALGRDERHREALAPGGLVLIHVARPGCEFIGRAELATACRDWTAAESRACPGGGSGGVLLADVEEWNRPVPLHAAVHRIDPKASNANVQGNAAGFQSAIVLITAEEYATVVALSREAGTLS